MSSLTQEIIMKLHRLERVSSPALNSVLDFVNYLESRLPVESSENVEKQDNTAAFLLGLAESFTDGLTNDELRKLPVDGAENHDQYLYKD